jgi:Zn-dependent oligopeptidase
VVSPFSSEKLCAKLASVSAVKEIQAAIPNLSREEIEQIRQWIDDYLEGQLELSDEVKARLDQSRAEIAAGESMR